MVVNGMTDRDANGRFVKGSIGNPTGRSPREREERYYQIMMSTVTFENWKSIILKAVQQAEKGDAQARKWLGDYLVGAAIQKLDITSGGESIKPDNEKVNRAISTLADAIRETIPGAGDKPDRPVDATEQAPMVSVPK